MTQPHACGICNAILRLFQEAADSGARLEFTVEERQALMARCEKSIEESTAVLAARGWFEFPDGSWNWLDPNQVQ